MAINHTSPIEIHVTTANGKVFANSLEEAFAISLKEAFDNPQKEAFFNSLEADLDNQSKILFSPHTSCIAKNEAANQLQCFAPSREKEAELFAILKSSKDPDKQAQALKRIYQSVYPTIYFLAHEFRNKCPNLEESDLVSYGCIGVQDALDHFDPAKANGAKFSSYAYPFIKHAITEACINFMGTVHLTVAQFKRAKMVLAAKKAFMLEFGREPSVDELQERLPEGYSRKYIRTYLTGTPRILSLDAKANPDDPDDNTIGRDIYNDPNYSDSVRDDIIKNEYTALLFENLYRLDKRTQAILKFHYGLNGEPKMKLAEIGELLHISTQSVSRIAGDGIIQLRALMTMPGSVA